MFMCSPIGSNRTPYDRPVPFREHVTLEALRERDPVALRRILYRKAHERRRTHAREELSDTLDEAFEARFNRDGSWREPPLPADRLVAAGETARSVNVWRDFRHNIGRSSSCASSTISPRPMSVDCLAVPSTTSASCFTERACVCGRVSRRRVGGDHDDDVQRGLDARLDGTSR